MDYDDISNDFFLVSMFIKHPLISITIVIIGCFFLYKACLAEDECSHKKCNIGTPMFIKGEYLCTERAQ